nr:MAG TPA: Exonuclease V [Crassvirales sp.]
MFNVNPVYKELRLFFDEPEHKYTDSFGNSYKSTTTLLHEYQPKFDKKYWLKKKAKELGISTARLEKQWQDITNEACERGTKVHNGIEDGIRNISMFYDAVRRIRNDKSMTTVADINDINDYVKPLDLDAFIEATNNKYPDVYAVFDYYIKNGYKIYSEIGIFLPSVLVSGTIDILILREDQFVIGDWKTNRGGLLFESGYYKKDKSESPAQTTDIWVPNKEFLLPPLSHLPKCNGSIYNMQLSIYAFAVESILGIPNAGLWLCHIDSDFVLNKYGMPKRFPDGLYHIKKNPVEKTTLYKMKYLKKEVIEVLKDRHREIAATKVTSKDLFDNYE